eukprot:GHVN01103980.1.p1 GENE.GHVN01103980.1~~GHVN01103980.1.p1  ORF type:complete len:469 (-),score=64.15 GHVN01103980.1:406-1812(-)
MCQPKPRQIFFFDSIDVGGSKTPGGWLTDDWFDEILSSDGLRIKLARSGGEEPEVHSTLLETPYMKYVGDYEGVAYHDPRINVVRVGSDGLDRMRYGYGYDCITHDGGAVVMATVCDRERIGGTLNVKRLETTAGLWASIEDIPTIKQVMYTTNQRLIQNGVVKGYRVYGEFSPQPENLQQASPDPWFFQTSSLLADGYFNSIVVFDVALRSLRLCEEEWCGGANTFYMSNNVNNDEVPHLFSWNIVGHHPLTIGFRGKCLTVSSPTDIRVRLDECGSAGQHFNFRFDPHAMYRGWNVFPWRHEGVDDWSEDSPIFLKNENTGECILSEFGEDIFTNTAVQLNTACGNLDNWEEQRRYQLFLWLRKYYQIPSTTNRVVEVVIIESSGLCLTPLDDGQVVFRLCDVSDDQTWLIEPTNDNSKNIVNKKSNSCLSIESNQLRVNSNCSHDNKSLLWDRVKPDHKALAPSP